MEPMHYNVPYKSSTCWSAANGLDSCWTPCGRMSWYRWCFRWCCLWCGSAKWQQDFVGVVVVLNDFSTRKVKLEREREGGKVNFIVGLPPVLAFHPSGTKWIVNLSCFRIFQLFRLKYTNSDPDNHKKRRLFERLDGSRRLKSMKCFVGARQAIIAIFVVFCLRAIERLLTFFVCSILTVGELSNAYVYQIGELDKRHRHFGSVGTISQYCKQQKWIFKWSLR